MLPYVTVKYLIFQSTLPRGERRKDPGMQFPHRRFQSTLPRGERRSYVIKGDHADNFNPRSHEGSDYTYIICKQYGVISIHAPTRGATRNGKHGLYVEIFQSTLPRGERPVPCHFNVFFGYFNPRSHEGSDVCIASYT